MEDSKLIVAALIELSEAVDDLKKIIPDFGKVGIKTLEGISVDEVGDGLYKVTGVCPGCDGEVWHYIDTADGLTMDARHRVSDCDGRCPGGYFLPVTLSIFGVPVLDVNLESPSSPNLGLPSHRCNEDSENTVEGDGVPLSMLGVPIATLDVEPSAEGNV